MHVGTKPERMFIRVTPRLLSPTPSLSLTQNRALAMPTPRPQPPPGPAASPRPRPRRLWSVLSISDTLELNPDNRGGRGARHAQIGEARTASLAIGGSLAAPGVGGALCAPHTGVRVRGPRAGRGHHCGGGRGRGGTAHARVRGRGVPVPSWRGEEPGLPARRLMDATGLLALEGASLRSWRRLVT